MFYQHGVFCASYPLHVLFVTFLAFFILSWPVLVQLGQILSRDPSSEVSLVLDPAGTWESSDQRRRFKERFGGDYEYDSEWDTTVDRRRHLEQVSFRNHDDSNVIDKEFLLKTVEVIAAFEDSAAVFERSTQRAYPGSRTAAVTNLNANDTTMIYWKDICLLDPVNSSCVFYSVFDTWSRNRSRMEADDRFLLKLSSLWPSFSSNSSAYKTTTESVLHIVPHNHASTLHDTSAIITYGLDEYRLLALIGRNDSTAMLYEATTDILNSLWADTLMKVGLFSVDIESNASLVQFWAASRTTGNPRILYHVFGGKIVKDDVISTEFVVVCVSYVIVFLYVYFVLGRVELVKSRVALGFGSVFMMFSSLMMSVGLSSTIGVTTSLVPWEVLPFLILVIGVENIFVLTNAVVTTSMDLPVKERIGIGLSKVGYKMLISLSGELLLLILVSMIDVPALQEFCLFACVALIIDFMMQITFFATILSIDIRRLELTDLHQLHMRKRHPGFQYDDDDTSLGLLDSWSKRWSAFALVAIMAFIGFGFSKSPTSASSSMNVAEVTDAKSFETTMKHHAEALWDTINPTKNDIFVVIPNPLVITLMPPSAEDAVTPVYLGSEKPAAVVYEGKEGGIEGGNNTKRKKDTWTISVDNFQIEVSRQLFIVTFVMTLILTSAGCILISNTIIKIIRSPGKGGTAAYNRIAQDLDEQYITDEEPLQSRVITFVGSAVNDIEDVKLSKDGTALWSPGNGHIHLWNLYTSQNVTLHADLGLVLGATGFFKDSLSCLEIVGHMKVAFGSIGGRVFVEDATTGERVGSAQSAYEPPVISIAPIRMSSLEDGILVGRSDGAFDVFQMNENAFKHLRRFQYPCHSVFVDICKNPNWNDPFLLLDADGNVERGVFPDIQSSCPTMEDSSFIRGSQKTVCTYMNSTLDIVGIGTEQGDIGLYQLSTKRELVFIPGMEETGVGLETSRMSGESGSSRSSQYTMNGKSISRVVGSKLLGHSGPVMFLRIIDYNGHQYRARSCLVLGLVSAGIDEVVNLFELRLAIPTSSSGNTNAADQSITILSCKRIWSVKQPGCVRAACYKSVIVGCRRVRSCKENSQRDAPEDYTLRRRNIGLKSGDVRTRRQQEKDADESGWELFFVPTARTFETDGVAEIADSSSYERIVVGAEQQVAIGPDLLKGAGFSRAFVEEVLEQRRQRVTMLKTFTESCKTGEKYSNSSPADDKDEWVDEVEIASDNLERSSFESDVAVGAAPNDSSMLLPVLGVEHLAVERWGVGIGFGNQVKVALIDMDVMAQWKHANSTGGGLSRNASSASLERLPRTVSSASVVS